MFPKGSYLNECVAIIRKVTMENISTWRVTFTKYIHFERQRYKITILLLETPLIHAIESKQVLFQDLYQPRR